MSFEKFKILITDDDMDLRELLTEAIKNWGYEVSVARDGDEALRNPSLRTIIQRGALWLVGSGPSRAQGGSS